jgi:flagella basal body P-ring formation protein FlgA
VRSGQQVTLRARVGAIEARGVGVAVENGQSGSLIHVVNPDSRRTLIGRVVGAGEVEVVHGS